MRAKENARSGVAPLAKLIAKKIHCQDYLQAERGKTSRNITTKQAYARNQGTPQISKMNFKLISARGKGHGLNNRNVNAQAFCAELEEL